MTDETQEQPNTQKHKTYFNTDEKVSPNQKKFLIEMNRPVVFYDKRNKRINFSSSSIEIIANSSTFAKDDRFNYGSLLIVAKFNDETGQRTAPDLAFQKKFRSYTNINNLQFDYKNLAENILKAYANKKKVKLTNWREIKTIS